MGKYIRKKKMEREKRKGKTGGISQPAMMVGVWTSFCSAWGSVGGGGVRGRRWRGGCSALLEDKSLASRFFFWPKYPLFISMTLGMKTR